MLLGQGLGIAGADEFAPRIVTKRKGRKHHRRTDRFEAARRNRDDRRRERPASQSNEAVHSARAERIHTGVMPNIRARTPIPTQLDVIEMQRITDPEGADELVCAAVEGPLAGVRLRPDHEIEGRPVDRLDGSQQSAARRCRASP